MQINKLVFSFNLDPLKYQVLFYDGEWRICIVEKIRSLKPHRLINTRRLKHRGNGCVTRKDMVL